jgi:zinc protease
MGLLTTMSAYGWDVGYKKDEEAIIRNMTLEEHQALAQKYIHPDRMIYVVAGDAATQFNRLKTANFDEVFLMDSEGNTTDISAALKPAM